MNARQLRNRGYSEDEIEVTLAWRAELLHDDEIDNELIEKANDDHDANLGHSSPHCGEPEHEGERRAQS